MEKEREIKNNLYESVPLGTLNTILVETLAAFGIVWLITTGYFLAMPCRCNIYMLCLCKWVYDCPMVLVEFEEMISPCLCCWTVLEQGFKHYYNFLKLWSLIIVFYSMKENHFVYFLLGNIHLQRSYNRVHRMPLCQLWLWSGTVEVERVWTGRYLWGRSVHSTWKLPN